MSRTVDRRALFASGAAAAFLTAAGVSAASTPRRGGKLRIALSGASRDDSWTSGDGLFMRVAKSGVVFNTLTEIAADGTLQPGLAVKWQVAEHGRTWCFKLREGVTFHDGSMLGADDVVASLRDTLTTADVTANNDVVTVHLAEANLAMPFLLDDPQYVIRPAHAMDSGIGTGLYQLRHFAPGQQLLADRVATHWKDGAAGWFDRVELVSIPSEEVRAQAVAEYLVDAADISTAKFLRGVPDTEILKNTALSRQLVRGRDVGLAQPLDDLRAPERWWYDSGA